jgi:hypothetical protein
VLLRLSWEYKLEKEIITGGKIFSLTELAAGTLIDF